MKIETYIEVKLNLKVPGEQVDEVSNKLIDLVTELGVYDGGKLEQSEIKLDI